jgi:hypothetical protein
MWLTVNWPPTFPRTQADFEEWQVFADELIERGDRRLGELLAHGLALVPNTDTLAMFQTLARKVCQEYRWFDVGWCLGRVRSSSSLSQSTAASGLSANG